MSNSTTSIRGFVPTADVRFTEGDIWRYLAIICFMEGDIWRSFALRKAISGNHMLYGRKAISGDHMPYGKRYLAPKCETNQERKHSGNAILQIFDPTKQKIHHFSRKGFVLDLPSKTGELLPLQRSSFFIHEKMMSNVSLPLKRIREELTRRPLLFRAFFLFTISSLCFYLGKRWAMGNEETVVYESS